MKKLFLHFHKKVKFIKHNQAWCSTIKNKHKGQLAKGNCHLRNDRTQSNTSQTHWSHTFVKRQKKRQLDGGI
jgi:hypothetical protein